MSSGASATLNGVTATRNTSGFLHSGATLSVTNAVVSGNTSYGFYLGSSSLATSIDSSTIYGNGYGIWEHSAYSGQGPTAQVANSIISGNTYYGIYKAYGASTLMTTYSDVWGNGTNYDGVTLGTGCLSQNPNFVNPPSDLRLQSSSVLIDQGTASGAPDRDIAGTVRPLDGDGINGAGYDMGAYEYDPGQ